MAKRLLSSQVETTLDVEELYHGKDFYMKLTRANFEDICQKVLDKCVTSIEIAMKDSKLRKDQIDEIVLVGGSTRIPKIQQLVSEYFGGKALNKSVNPDEAVAVGAAIQGAILAGE